MDGWQSPTGRMWQERLFGLKELRDEQVSLLVPAVVVVLTAGLKWGGFRLLAPHVLEATPLEWEEVTLRIYAVSGFAGALVSVAVWPAASAMFSASMLVLWKLEPDYRKMRLLTGFAHIPLLIRSLLLFLFLRGGHGENLINFYLSGHYFFQAGGLGLIYCGTGALLAALGYCVLGLRMHRELCWLRAGGTIAFPSLFLVMSIKLIQRLS